MTFRIWTVKLLFLLRAMKLVAEGASLERFMEVPEIRVAFESGNSPEAIALGLLAAI